MRSARVSILASVYKGEAYLPAYIAQLQQQTMFNDAEVVFVCNEPSAAELEIIQTFQASYPAQVQVHSVPREPLGASWNRAWAAASASLLAIWNIDDCREPDSLERQVRAMEGADWALCYGDYVTVPKYGEREGHYRSTPIYDAAHFARAFAQGGAFWVVRREVANHIGYFDEQLHVAADMDFSLRMAANGLRMGRVDGVLGYFTDAAQGLSTREGGREALVERTVVQLRYGVYDKVQPELLAASKRMRLDAVQNFGQWRPLTELMPDYVRYLRKRQPLWLLGKLRFALRGVLAKLGLLPRLHSYFNKEL